MPKNHIWAVNELQMLDKTRPKKQLEYKSNI